MLFILFLQAMGYATTSPYYAAQWWELESWSALS